MRFYYCVSQSISNLCRESFFRISVPGRDEIPNILTFNRFDGANQTKPVLIKMTIAGELTYNRVFPDKFHDICNLSLLRNAKSNNRRLCGVYYYYVNYAIMAARHTRTQTGVDHGSLFSGPDPTRRVVRNCRPDPHL